MNEKSNSKSEFTRKNTQFLMNPMQTELLKKNYTISKPSTPRIMKSSEVPILDNLEIEKKLLLNKRLSTKTKGKSDEKMFADKLGFLTPNQSKNSKASQPNTFIKRATISEIRSHKSMDIQSPITLNMLKACTEKDREEMSKKTIQLKVAARFRPLNKVESELNKNGENFVYKIISDKTISFNRNHDNSFFTFDKVFDVNATQLEVYEEIGKETIDEVLKGYNGTIFAYGQSGSGKTHSMYGADINDPELKGIVPRSVEHIFNYIEEEKNNNINFEIKFSLLEIYKEQLYDLLNPEIELDSTGERHKLKLKEDPEKGVYIQGLTEEYISEIDEFFEILEQAEKYRVVSETYLNKASSRSHMLLKFEIIQKFPDGIEKRGILNLVDLAGSEKVSKTGAIGETLEEAIKINLSLSALGNVISSLATKNSSDGFVPYRDSKLTRILRDSLGGNFKTTLIVTCSPHMYNAEETLSTLNFAQRAKKIKTIVGINVKRSPEELEKIILQLNDQIKKMKNDTMKINDKNVQRKVSQIFFATTLNRNNKSDDESFISEDNTIRILNHEQDETCDMKNKDEEIKQLKEEIIDLKDEIKDLKNKIEISNNKEQNENKIITDLENLVKFNIEEIKKLKKADQEINNEFFNQYESISPKKQFDANYPNNFTSNLNLDELQYANFDLFLQDENVYDISKKFKKFNYNFKEFYSKFDNITKSNKKMIENNSFNLCNFNTDYFRDAILSTVNSYENIFSGTKLYMNSIFDEFLSKRNFFDRDYLSKDEYNLKNAFMNISLLNISYEKIIFNFSNKLLIDLKKFCFSEIIKNEQNNRLDSICYLMENYMSLLQYVKSLKYSESQKVPINRENINKFIPTKNIIRPVKRRSSFLIQTAQRTFKFQSSLQNKESFVKPYQQENINNVSEMKSKRTNGKDSICGDSSDEDSDGKLSNNGRRQSIIKADKRFSLKREAIIENTQEEEDDTKNDPKRFKSFNLKKLSSRLKINEAETDEKNNIIINNSITSEQNTSQNDNLKHNNLKNYSSTKLNKDFNNYKENTENSIGNNINTRNEKMVNVNMTTLSNQHSITKDHHHLSSSINNYNTNYTDDNTLIIVKKELNLYKNYIGMLKKENSKLKSVNFELENSLKEYTSNFPQDVDNFAQCHAVLKKMYDEDMKNKSNKIDLLTRCIDEILMNKGAILNESNLENSYILRNYFDQKKNAIIYETNNNNDFDKISQTFLLETGGATKKINNNLSNLNIDFKDIKIDTGSGLQLKFPGVSPLFRTLKQSLKGDELSFYYNDSCDEEDEEEEYLI